MSFTQEAHNVAFIGGTGTGKTHLATALGVAGNTQQSKRVRFYSTVDLVNMLEQEKASHHWARKLRGFGHTVKLMAPLFVKPYVKTNKNDAADAEAIRILQC